EVIFQNLLSEQTLMLTSDRPFHNTLLKHKLRSFYIDSELTISGKELTDIKSKNFDDLPKPIELKDNYRQTDSDIRKRIMPTSEKTLKRLRTKRRRIRNYFGGLDNIHEMAATLSFRDDIIAIKLTASSKAGNKKGMTASESYIREPTLNSHLEAPFCHLLALLLQLMLEDIPLMIFYDEAVLQEPQQQGLYKELLQEFSTLKFIPTCKGFQLEGQRRKLKDLSRGQSNEIVDSVLKLKSNL
ncbi:MAG: hypothetical protein HRT88_15045, partial [Lentisphaeraceae bacterium]|nr:hypothetical protein [Lentisphaeraceae bacterium]